MSGFYSIVFAYHILNGVGMQKLHINEENIFDETCVFLEKEVLFQRTPLISTTEKGNKYLQGFKKSFFVLFSAQHWQNETMRPMSELVS